MSYKRSRDELEEIESELKELPQDAVVGEILFELSSDTQSWVTDLINPPMLVTVADILVSLAEQIEDTEDDEPIGERVASMRKTLETSNLIEGKCEMKLQKVVELTPIGTGRPAKDYQVKLECGCEFSITALGEWPEWYVRLKTLGDWNGKSWQIGWHPTIKRRKCPHGCPPPG